MRSDGEKARYGGWFCVVAALLLLGTPPEAEGEWRLSSTLDAEESFDSNIYLHPDDEKSDFITTIIPGFTLEDATATRTVAAHYTLSLVTFARYREENYVGHTAGLSWDQQLSRYLSWYVRDTFYRTNEPLEEDPTLTDVRRERNEYYRNTIEGGLRYQFGREDTLTLSYTDGRVQNQDPEVEDSLEYGPGATIDYWLTPSHGISLTHRFLRREYGKHLLVSAGGGRQFEPTPGDRTESSGAGYRWRWSPHTTLRLDYGYERFSSQDRAEEDYVTHDASMGLATALGPTWSLDSSVGYYYSDPDDSPADDGLSYSLTLGKTFSQGGLSITGEGGHRSDYTGAERRGFSQYRGVSVSATRSLGPRLEFRATAAYLHEGFREVEDRRDETMDALLGLNYRFRPWLVGALELTHRERSSSEAESEYRDSIALCRLSALHEWR